MNGKIAWGDESVRIVADEPMYMVAACIMEKAPLEKVEKLKKLMPPNAKKIHWRDMGTGTQKKALQIISEISHSTYIAVASPIQSNKQERARRKCLEALLPTLEQQGVALLVLESRGSYLDKKDVDFLFYLRRNGLVDSLDLTHATGSSEPCLSIPDQILGAYSELAANKSKKPVWLSVWNKITASITTISVDFR